MVCLGQNDGEQEPGAFQTNYVRFLQTLREAYPKATIVCLTSPMASGSLRKYQVENLSRIVANRNSVGDKNVSMFAFSRGFNKGCGGHPDVADHAQIAGELSSYLKTQMKW